MEVTQGEEILEQINSKYGFIPNLYQELVDAGAVSVLKIYLQTMDLLGESSLNMLEQQTLMLTVSTYNECDFCKAAHTMMTKMNNLPVDDINAIKEGGLPSDERLAQLVTLTRTILEKRGFLSDEEVAELSAQGIERQQIYEIIAIVGIKTISNYVNHIAHTEVNAELLA